MCVGGRVCTLTYPFSPSGDRVGVQSCLAYTTTREGRGDDDRGQGCSARLKSQAPALRESAAPLSSKPCSLAALGVQAQVDPSALARLLPPPPESQLATTSTLQASQGRRLRRALLKDQDRQYTQHRPFLASTTQHQTPVKYPSSAFFPHNSAFVYYHAWRILTNLHNVIETNFSTTRSSGAIITHKRRNEVDERTAASALPLAANMGNTGLRCPRLLRRPLVARCSP